MSIIFENVTKTIRGKIVLRDVTLPFEPGRICGGLTVPAKQCYCGYWRGLFFPNKGKFSKIVKLWKNT